MANSYTGRIRLIKQSTGSNLNTWGDLQSTADFDLIDDAIGGYTTIDMTGLTSDVTLTSNLGLPDQARSPMLLLTGVMVSNVGVVFPSVSQSRWVRNNTTGAFSATVKCLGGSGVQVPQGKILNVICDGTSVTPGTVAVSADFPSLGTAASRNIGTSAAAVADVSLGNLIWAELSAANVFTSSNTFNSSSTFAGEVALAGLVSLGAGAASPIVTLTDAASIDLNFAVGINFVVTLGGNRTLSYPSGVRQGQSGYIYVAQDATGNRTLAFNTSYKFPGGNAPTMTATASAVDILPYIVRGVSVIDMTAANDMR